MLPAHMKQKTMTSVPAANPARNARHSIQQISSRPDTPKLRRTLSRFADIAGILCLLPNEDSLRLPPHSSHTSHAVFSRHKTSAQKSVSKSLKRSQKVSLVSQPMQLCNYATIQQRGGFTTKSAIAMTNYDILWPCLLKFRNSSIFTLPLRIVDFGAHRPRLKAARNLDYPSIVCACIHARNASQLK